MRRKRSYIPFSEKLAATLACLLSQEHRDDLRSRKVPASEVLSLFQFDHIVLHAIGGSDFWHNLDPKLIHPHREKSKRDTSIVAKAKRIDQWTALAPLVQKQEKATVKTSKWPKRKIQSRGFGR